jgi:hypothetical protein
VLFKWQGLGTGAANVKSQPSGHRNRAFCRQRLSASSTSSRYFPPSEMGLICLQMPDFTRGLGAGAADVESQPSCYRNRIFCRLACRKGTVIDSSILQNIPVYNLWAAVLSESQNIIWEALGKKTRRRQHMHKYMLIQLTNHIRCEARVPASYELKSLKMTNLWAPLRTQISSKLGRVKYG